MVPDTKNGYVKLIENFASDLQAVRQGVEATTEKLSDQEASLSKLDLKILLLAKNIGLAGDLQELLDTKVGDLKSANRSLASNGSVLKENNRVKGILVLELGAARPTIGQR